MPTGDERLVRRTCGWCGTWIEYRGTGRRPKFCSKSCRQRDYEVHAAERRLGRDLTAGRATAGPVREVVSRPAPPVPTTRGSDWTRLLAELTEQLRDGQLGRQHWDHAKVARGLYAALAALDAATPGGLNALERR
jgi:endogenous inhibitor of DNA gyrase (YacG/DUF329 family)